MSITRKIFIDFITNIINATDFFVASFPETPVMPIKLLFNVTFPTKFKRLILLVM